MIYIWLAANAITLVPLRRPAETTRWRWPVMSGDLTAQCMKFVFAGRATRSAVDSGGSRLSAVLFSMHPSGVQCIWSSTEIRQIYAAWWLSDLQGWTGV